MDKVNINIQAGDFKLPLKVEADEEPIYREAARLVTERLATYRAKYRVANLNPEYILMFVALDVASRYVKLSRVVDVKPVEDALQGLVDQLTEFNQQQKTE